MLRDEVLLILKQQETDLSGEEISRRQNDAWVQELYERTLRQ